MMRCSCESHFNARKFAANTKNHVPAAAGTPSGVKACRCTLFGNLQSKQPLNTSCFRNNKLGNNLLTRIEHPRTIVIKVQDEAFGNVVIMRPRWFRCVGISTISPFHGTHKHPSPYWLRRWRRRTRRRRIFHGRVRRCCCSSMQITTRIARRLTDI